MTIKTLLKTYIGYGKYINIRIYQYNTDKILYQSFTSDDDRQNIYLESLAPKIPKELLKKQVYLFDVNECFSEKYIEIYIID